MTTLKAMPDKSVHEGRNVKRIREILGIKQDALAMDLGLTQQAISQLEQKEALDAEMIEKIAKVMKVSSEAIKNFNDEAANNYINTFNDSSTGAFNNYNCSFNPIDKVVELYERMLKDKSEMIEKLEEILKKNKT